MSLLNLCERDADKLRIFIGAIDGDFKPAISSRINLRSYAHKLLKCGDVIAAISANQSILGTIGVYCNDRKNATGYISILGVRQDMRTKGVGSALLDAGISRCSKAGMARVITCTRQANTVARKMYKSRGFQEAKSTEDNRLELILKLHE